MCSTAVAIELVEFCDVTYKEIVHQISVRWLGLQASIDRTLLQYPALKSYFLPIGERRMHFEYINTFIMSFLIYYLDK